jgi:hypothetical protein
VTPAPHLPMTRLAYEKELANDDHPVIQDKIVVIAPFDLEHCTVVVGSQNLANKASSSNDESHHC